MTAAIDALGVVELAGKRIKMSLEHEDAKRNGRGAVDQNETDRAVEQVQAVEQDV